MRVLVTGGAGYIGSQTAKALAHAGFEPVTVDNLVTGHEWAVRWGPFVRGDVGDRELMRQVLRRHHVEAVVHFAASAYVGESVHKPQKYFHNNVANTLVLLDAMMEAGVHHIVFSSSCATYGTPDALPIRDDCPQQPVNPYGESKLFVERVLRAYSDAYGLRSVALRYFNAAGADPDGELGEEHDPETHLIPLVIEAALGLRPDVEIFGIDYPTPDHTAIRDFIHVADLAAAHVQALDRLMAGSASVALNLGTGIGHSVREVIAMVEHVSGRRVPVREVPRRAGDPPALLADAQRARELLGWQPQYAQLEAIVASAWAWHAGGSRRAHASSTSASARALTAARPV